jgi:hypothetical protein
VLRRSTLLIALVLLFVSLIVNLPPAQAASNVSVTGTGPSFTITMTGTTNDSGFGVDLIMVVCYDANNVIIDTDWNGTPPTSTPATAGQFCDNIFAVGTLPYRLEIYDMSSLIPENDLSQMSAIQALPKLYPASSASAPSGAVTFFNPGDDRIDPRPGERITVWCNQKDKIVVYGIADDQPANKSGFLLGVFSYKEVKAAGEKGLTKKVENLGSVSISIKDGWAWIAWNGGKYNATGRDIFVKNFDAVKWCAI